MKGEFSAFRDARLPLRVIGPLAEVTLQFVIDTGFDGCLTLPGQVIQSIGLIRGDTVRVELGDGSRHEMEEFRADVEWAGRIHSVFVLQRKQVPLIGIGLLYGHRLTIDVVDGGPVTVSPLA